jgi:uncharacterized protein YbjT (DUF2867 family)
VPGPARRVLVTGASGFVGGHVLAALLARGHEVVTVTRRLNSGRVEPRVIQVAADIAGEGWQRWCEGCDAAIHLVGIIREGPESQVTFDRVHRLGTERVVNACRDAGISRLIYVSALGVGEHAATPYQRSKWAAEQAVRTSGLQWTIFRPSIIFGPGDGLCATLVPAVRRLPIVPVFGDGNSRVQPMAVEEVTACLVQALDLPAAVGGTFELGGPEALTFNELLRRIAATLALRRALVHLPLGISRALVRAVQLLPEPPITPDQLTMLLQGSTCDTSAASLVFGAPTRRYDGPTWLTPTGLPARGPSTAG